ncbi:uncharacterized protein LTHEOB_12212 [Lasiodiplodia theobromae]|uniref:uncharacterized protein n=1 Tax=Lasiodiplodia theobromae TaxID=45133 RepID=UPI0015C38864|nr:uncharacterized protein LTHEOB_12212 [Lasiodiplodia theobromae]KAF4536507.1 hypothetical protein LTHEOB_12212 [Lasiodiplodia theobromae]
MLVLTLLLFVPCFAAATSNSGYFSFPLKADDVPTVHNADVLNVTWYSLYDQAVLYFWCSQTLMDTVRGLGGDGSLQYTVNTSWSSPCHWQYAKQSDESKYMDSGFVDVTNLKATPIVTWGPKAAGVACGASTVTATASAATIITTVTATPAASNATADQEPKQPLGTGASIGIGVAIGAVVTGIVSVLCFVGRKRAQAQSNQAAAAAYHDDRKSFYELNSTSRPVEADNSWSGHYANAVELPPVPFPHDTPARHRSDASSQVK